MADIVLTTLNARYAHASLALRYLCANLGALADRAEIREATIHDRPVDVAEELLGGDPRIVGVGVYIWNATQTLELVQLLKRVRPEVIVVLGGPEVSHETNLQPIVRAADYTITGEGDCAFAALCRSIVLDGERPRAPIIHASPPSVTTLALPYELYGPADIRDRIIYVEASRGCPFSCEFCLSSLDRNVRQFPLPAFLSAMQRLIDRGARQFKFIDRTFNLSLRVATTILQFFLDRVHLGLFVHFEMVPDRLPDGLRALLERFPPGTVQLEVGIQTFDPDVAARISRRQDVSRLEANLRFLREHTGVHVHADLIVGLPGEDLETFAAGFDRLVALGPQEIQVGILKRLRGTPIVRHDDDWDVVFSATPPYEILSNRLIPFATMQRMKRFARAWDLTLNSGNFRETGPLLWKSSTPFAGFLAFTDWLFDHAGHFKGIALDRLTRLLFDYLTGVLGQTRDHVGPTLARDYTRPGRRLPHFLADFEHAVLAAKREEAESRLLPATPKRQARHL